MIIFFTFHSLIAAPPIAQNILTTRFIIVVSFPKNSSRAPHFFEQKVSIFVKLVRQKAAI